MANGLRQQATRLSATVDTFGVNVPLCKTTGADRIIDTPSGPQKSTPRGVIPA